MSVSPQAAGYDEQLAAAGRFLREHDDYLVVSHVNPDGDAASSTFAVGLLLRRLGKTYTLINEGSVPEKFARIGSGQAIRKLGDLAASPSYTYVICVDCADYARIGEVNRLIAEDALILNIDHHATNDHYGRVNAVRKDAASTTEVIYDLVEAMDEPLDTELATCLYTGLLTDTGGFRYANTSPKVLRIASRLIAAGVSGSELAEWYLETITMAHVQLLKRSLATLSFSPDGKIAWLYVTQEDIAESGANDEDLEGLVNYSRNIAGVEVGLFFKQKDSGTVKVSLRSNGSTDVSRVAQALGGGGHVRAAGCTVAGSIPQAIDRVLEQVERSLS